MRRPGCRCDESESTPLHIGSLPGYLAGIQESLQGGKWNEGDVVIHNHPYYGSSHSPDIAVVIPVFHKGELVAYSANTAHHLDIGAATPGLIIDIPDVYAEGMLFAGTKLYEEGRRNEALWEYIRRNSRAARQLQDDLDAQIASARLGVRRFNELLERYSLMANTRNNPLEDLAVHLPMICDRYELRDDVMPGAGRFRGGIGVVKKQRILTDDGNLLSDPHSTAKQRSSRA